MCKLLSEKNNWVKKTELSTSCQFYWCDINFFRDVCKLPSVVNFDCDLSLIIDAAEVHYNFRVKKNWFVKIAVCHEYFFWSFWRYYHGKSVQIIIFLILYLYFEVLFDGTGARNNFFWILWRSNYRKNESQTSLMCWT